MAWKLEVLKLEKKGEEEEGEKSLESPQGALLPLQSGAEGRTDQERSSSLCRPSLPLRSCSASGVVEGNALPLSQLEPAQHVRQQRSRRGLAERSQGRAQRLEPQYAFTFSQDAVDVAPSSSCDSPLPPPSRLFSSLCSNLRLLLLLFERPPFRLQPPFSKLRQRLDPPRPPRLPSRFRNPRRLRPVPRRNRQPWPAPPTRRPDRLHLPGSARTGVVQQYAGRAVPASDAAQYAAEA